MYTMKYCLEIDLVANEASRTKYCEVMNVPDNNDASKVLLHDKKDAIKSPDKILQVVTGIAPVQYPYSFKKIRTALTYDINSSF